MTFRHLIEKQIITNQDVHEMNIAIDMLESGDYLNESLLDSLTGAIKQKIDFIKELASQSGKKLEDIIVLFKDTRVFKFFKLISFNLGKLFVVVKKGFTFYNELQRIIAKWVSSNKAGRWTEAKLKELDTHLMNHPNLKKITGIAVAGLLLFIWLNMSFTGDFLYDFDWSDIIMSLSGSFSLAELFAGTEGTRLLLLFASGSLLGLSFPWGGTLGTRFALAVVTGLIQITRKK